MANLIKSKINIFRYCVRATAPLVTRNCGALGSVTVAFLLSEKSSLDVGSNPGIVMLFEVMFYKPNVVF